MMTIVYATDVKFGDENGVSYPRKRGDAFSSGDSDEFFDGTSAEQLVEDGVLVDDSLLPEHYADPTSASLAALEAAEAATKAEEAGELPDPADVPPMGDTGEGEPPAAKAPTKAATTSKASASKAE